MATRTFGTGRGFKDASRTCLLCTAVCVATALSLSFSKLTFLACGPSQARQAAKHPQPPAYPPRNVVSVDGNAVNGTARSGHDRVDRQPGLEKVDVKLWEGTNKIQHILHRVFIPSWAEWEKQTQGISQTEYASFRKEWISSCQYHHSSWRHMFWDEERGLALLNDKYPWFVPIYESYDSYVKKSDALRVFVLHAYGGVYLDSDIECLRGGEDMLRDYDMVLQLEWHDKLTQSAMAATKGAPMLQRIIEKFKERHESSKTNPMHSEVRYLTGVELVTEIAWTVLDTMSTDGYQARPDPTAQEVREGLHAVDDGGLAQRIMVYNTGMWTQYCRHSFPECHRDFAEKLLSGTVPLGSIMAYHRYSGSWNGDSGRTSAVNISAMVGGYT